MKTIVKNDRHYASVEGYDDVPTTVLDVLKVSREVIASEGHWVKGNAFRNPHTEVDPSTPFCNSWGVCAIGAVQVVVLGLVKRDSPFDSEDAPVWADASADNENRYSREASRLYCDAVKRLNLAAREVSTQTRYVAGIVDLNDRARTTHAQVVGAFDRAIELEQELLEKQGASAPADA